MGSRARDGRRWENATKMIKMQYVHVPFPQGEWNSVVLQTHNNKRGNKE